MPEYHMVNAIRQKDIYVKEVRIDFQQDQQNQQRTSTLTLFMTPKFEGICLLGNEEQNAKRIFQAIAGNFEFRSFYSKCSQREATGTVVFEKPTKSGGKDILIKSKRSIRDPQAKIQWQYTEEMAFHIGQNGNIKRYRDRVLLRKEALDPLFRYFGISLEESVKELQEKANVQYFLLK